MKNVAVPLTLLLIITLIGNIVTAAPPGSNLQVEPAAVPEPQPEWVLRNSTVLSEVPTTVGYIHSSQYLKTELWLKFSGLSQIKASIDGGPLSVEGTVTFGSSTEKYYRVEDGVSKRIVYLADYIYELYENVNPDFPETYKEVWKMKKFYSLSGALRDGNIPSQPHGTSFDILILGPGYNVSRVYFHENVKGTISVGASVVLEGSWKVFTGSVPLGASVSLSYYQQKDQIYKLTTLDSANEHRWDVYKDGWVLSFVFKY